jgi:hypothetical protein
MAEPLHLTVDGALALGRTKRKLAPRRVNGEVSELGGRVKRSSLSCPLFAPSASLGAPPAQSTRKRRTGRRTRGRLPA